MTRPDPTEIEVPSFPSGVRGAIRVPPSKSLTQRALVAAGLAGAGARVLRPLDAEDPRLLHVALEASGWELGWAGDAVTVEARRAVAGAAVEMGNNGTGLRFLLAQLANQPGRWIVDSSTRLRERPIGPLVTALRGLGAKITAASGGCSDRLPLAVAGRRLTGGSVRVDPAASSQFVSALLLLAPALPGGLEVRLTSAAPSRPYLDLTVGVLRELGAAVAVSPDGMTLCVRGPLRPADLVVEGDWSAAAFPLAAAALVGGEVEVLGVCGDSRQGDAAVVGILERAGCPVVAADRSLLLRGPVTRPVEADLRDTPDMFPALSVVVAAHGGRLTGLEGLRVKESDRLGIMTERLTALGFRVSRDASSFAAPGTLRPSRYRGAGLEPAADHRVAMAQAVAGCLVPGVRIADPGCVAKSWPDFWGAWEALARGPA